MSPYLTEQNIDRLENRIDDLEREWLELLDTERRAMLMIVRQIEKIQEEHKDE